MIRGLIVLSLTAPAAASTVMHLEPAQLAAGADRVVEARVVSRTVVWNAGHTGLETHAVLATDGGETLSLVQPGGELDGARHVIVGMPSITVGERARWFLRDRGDGTVRVYGWSQGKWPLRAGRYVSDPVAAERDPLRFTTNGMVWPADKIPVQYLVQTAGSQDLSLPDEIAAIDAAFATWQAVPTAALAFHNNGMTNLGEVVDGNNVILFTESNWIYGEEAAAATSVFIIDGMQTADINVNGQTFTWANSPPGAGIASNILDLQAVLTHEIGHFSGLNHTERAFDTMYFSWKPWQGQRTLSVDDKLGLSSVYPVSGDECAGSGQSTCPAEERCTQHPLGHLCEGTPDPVGSACNFNRVECDNFCLFTAVNLSTGYCSKFCETDHDCPLTHHCAAAMAGTMPVMVCFSGAQPLCMDADCPAGQHCEAASNACSFECRADEDCGENAACDDRGFCIAVPPPVDEGGCSTGATPGILLGLLGWLGFTYRRRSS